jgi:hypothetical protein
MRDVEWTLRRLSESGILGDKETDALKSACLIVAQLRIVLDYNPSKVTVEDVNNKIFYRTGGEQ